MADLKLFSFHWDCGRMGDVEGLFAATQEDVDALIGKEIYFGEILGKHSEVYGELTAGALTHIEVDSAAIEQIIAVTGTTISGYNPFDYYEGEEE